MKSHSTTIKESGREVPTSLTEAADMLRRLGSDRDPVTYLQGHTTVRGMAVNEEVYFRQVWGSSRTNPMRVHITYNALNSRGRLVIVKGTILGMIVDRIRLREKERKP